MRMRRNQSSAAPTNQREASCPSCFYDEVFGTAQALAAGGSTTVNVEIEWDRYMCSQFADVVVMSAADSQINERAILTDVEIQGCSQLGQDSAAAVASPGIVLPDQLSASAECCLGTPVCWGAFGKTGLNEQIVFSLTSLSAATVTDTYFLIRGQAMSSLPQGWRLGKRCTRQ